jgi:aminoglycoside phosphotransferase (APT) family kinase protein
MIPELKKAAVARALTETFGVSECEDIRRLNTEKHTSAYAFRIVVRERPYLLRVITRTDANTDPTRQFTCMKIAAEAGLAPRVLYTSIEDRVSLIDFVQARPLPASEAAVRLAVTLRALHALPPFPALLNDYDTSPTFLLRRTPLRDGFIQRFQDARILPPSETGELIQLYAQVAGVYRRDDSDLVSSHNDLKPENLVFDGERVWLVDWEAAFQNDRYSDLAVMANFVVTNDAEEQIYLRTYFGESVDEYRLARYYLMRQVVHMFYTMAFMLSGSAGRPVELALNAAAFRAFHDRMWAGDVSLADVGTKVEYGKIHLNQLLENTRGRRFQEALQIVSDRQAREASH